MAIYRGPYYSASGCTGTKPGVQAATSWFLGAYGDRNAANLGTYVCKRLGSGWSIHADGRAADWGTAPYGVPSGWGWDLANALRDNSKELGIQLIIFEDKIWSASRPDDGWRDYSGDWHGHLHVEFTPTAARTLTAAVVEQHIGGGGGGNSGTAGGDDDMIGLREGDGIPVSAGGRGDDWLLKQKVEALQATLRVAGFSPGAADGAYGPKTSKAVLACRKAQGSTAKTGDVIDGHAYEQIHRAHAESQGGGKAEDGKDGRDGKDASPEQIGAAVEAWMDGHRDELRGPPGEVPTEIAIRGLVLETTTGDADEPA